MRCLHLPRHGRTQSFTQPSILAPGVDSAGDLLQGGTVTAIVPASRGLARRRLGTGALAVFLISASGPMTVLVGGVVTTFAVTGNVGTPLCYPILAVALTLFSVGYAAMSRYVQSAGGFYPYLAQG